MLTEGRTIGGGECRASGENHAVTGLYVSVACRSDDGFDDRGRNNHSWSEYVPARLRHYRLRKSGHGSDRRRQLPDDLVPKLRRVLTLLDEARNPGDLASQPGYRLHPLKGDMAGLWSIRVSGNWRVVFRFEDNEAVDVDLVDYH